MNYIKKQMKYSNVNLLKILINIYRNNSTILLFKQNLTESLGSIGGIKTPSLPRSVQAGGKSTNSNFLKAKLPKSNLI